jgi:hypothetical protein
MSQLSPSRHITYGAVGDYQTKIQADASGKTQVIFYQTPVVTFDDQMIQLNTGGWWTRSTKVRMNQASQEFGLGYRVFQKKGEWFVAYQDNIRPFTEQQLTLSR